MSSSQYKFWSVLLAGTAALAASLGGCAGNGEGLNANGVPVSGGSGGGGGTLPLGPDFEAIQQNVFTPICSPCHSGAGAPQGLMLDAAHSYADLVGVPSNEVPSLNRVKPGDPDNSYIIIKLTKGPGIVGGQMPLNETPLPQSTIDFIRQWIANGAPQASTSSADAMQKLQSLVHSAPPPFRVNFTSPLDEAVVQPPVRNIVVAFNNEVDASLVNYTTLTVERVDIAAAADPSTPALSIPSYVKLAEGNASTVVITPVAPLLPGIYRVTARGSGGGALADLNAQALGSDYSFKFTVDGSP
jgi:Bacterial Ig-like domain